MVMLIDIIAIAVCYNEFLAQMAKRPPIATEAKSNERTWNKNNDCNYENGRKIYFTLLFNFIL